MGHTHFLIPERSSTQSSLSWNTHIVFSLSSLWPLSFFDKESSLPVDGVYSRLEGWCPQDRHFINVIPAFPFMFVSLIRSLGSSHMGSSIPWMWPKTSEASSKLTRQHLFLQDPSWSSQVIPLKSVSALLPSRSVISDTHFLTRTLRRTAHQNWTNDDSNPGQETSKYLYRQKFVYSPFSSRNGRR